MSDPPSDTVATNVPRYTRRIWDHIVVAFHQACDQNDLEIADLLLAALQMTIARGRLPSDATERRARESLVAAYERLWNLRHPDPIEY